MTHFTMMYLLLLIVFMCYGMQGVSATVEGCTLYAALDDESIVYYDMSSLQLLQTSYEGTFENDQNVTYQLWMQVCGGCTKSSTCQENRGSVCVYEGAGSFDDDNYEAQLGQWNESPYPTFEIITSADANEGVNLIYTNGQWNEAAVTTTVIIPCDPDKDVPSLAVDVITNPDFTEFDIVMEASKAGCPVTASPVIPTNPVNDGVSAGTWFCVIILVGTFLYLAIGMVYKSSQLGTQGVESVPNVDFWRQLPGLIADGFRFVFTGCKTLSKGGNPWMSSVNYEEV